MELVTLSSALIVLILIGAPIGVAMAVLPAVYIAISGAVPLSTVPYQMYQMISNPLLVCVPFFILTGELMSAGQTTTRLMALSREIVGRIRGGTAHINILASMLFAGMNGSAVADTAAVGGALIPAMTKAGYSKAFAAALTAVASTIGGIIPPSIVMILLAGTTGLSVGALFAAGIIPGILIGVLMMAVSYLYARARNYEKYEQPFSLGGLWTAFSGASAALTLPLIIIGGIVFGIFSPIEAGAITALVAALIGATVHRALTLKGIGTTLVRSVELTSSVFIILAASGPFSWYLSRIGALQELGHWLAYFSGSQFEFSIVLVLLILIVGSVIETVPCIIILGPTLIKACEAAGFHEIQAALVLTIGFLIGTVSPLIGVCCFTASAIADEKIEKVAWELIPFVLVEIVSMFLVLYIPALTLFIPRALGLTNG